MVHPAVDRPVVVLPAADRRAVVRPAVAGRTLVAAGRTLVVAGRTLAAVDRTPAVDKEAAGHNQAEGNQAVVDSNLLVVAVGHTGLRSQGAARHTRQAPCQAETPKEQRNK
eukprot:m.145267 g.145267  ORF g.145267 m.145267 type:complete len:111 (+) comp17219_c1_seq2:252-584(+)